MSLSPAGDLLLFSLSPSAPADGDEALDRLHGRSASDDAIDVLASYVIHVLATGELIRPAVDRQVFERLAEERTDLFFGRPCWSPAGDSVYLGSSPDSAIALPVAGPTPEWVLAKRTAEASGACQELPSRGEQLLGDHGDFLIERSSGGSIVVRDRNPPRRVLLDRDGTLARPHVTLAEVAVAPGGQRLAVILSQGRGSFTGPLELWLVSRVDGDVAARRMGGPVYGVTWTSSGTQLLGASRIQGMRQLAIYRWVTPP